jgi:hypothetical protein
MLLRMASAIRALLASVLCTGLGLAVPCASAATAGPSITSPTHDPAIVCCPRATRRALALAASAADAPELVVPAPFVAPSRPLTASTRAFAAPPADIAPPLRVLDLAPKTSPPA